MIGNLTLDTLTLFMDPYNLLFDVGSNVLLIFLSAFSCGDWEQC